MTNRLQNLRASFWGAFFVCGLQLFPRVGLADCPMALDTNAAVTVRFVSDGDSVVLTDQRRVRLIGINTPEMGRKGQPHQPLAVRARDRLRALLFTGNNRVTINLGQKKQDRHGRWLAHLYLPDGRHLGEQLIRDGLGWVVAIAPNVTFASCLKTAENTARKANRGIWSEPAYTPVESASLKLRSRGFHSVQGRIRQVTIRPTARWIKLDGRFSIRIPKSALVNFKSRPDSHWVGRKIAVRGWLYASRGELHVNLEHPAALDIISMTRSLSENRNRHEESLDLARFFHYFR